MSHDILFPKYVSCTTIFTFYLFSFFHIWKFKTQFFRLQKEASALGPNSSFTSSETFVEQMVKPLHFTFLLSLCSCNSTKVSRICGFWILAFKAISPLLKISEHCIVNYVYISSNSSVEIWPPVLMIFGGGADR